MKLQLTKKNLSLVAEYNSDYDKIKKLKEGHEYSVTVKQIRNPRFHRKYFAMIKMVYDNWDNPTNRPMEDFRKDLQIRAGYYYEDIDLDGVVTIKSKSIAFENLDEIEFNELYERVKDVISEYFGLDNPIIEQNIERYY